MRSGRVFSWLVLFAVLNASARELPSPHLNPPLSTRAEDDADNNKMVSEIEADLESAEKKFPGKIGECIRNRFPFRSENQILENWEEVVTGSFLVNEELKKLPKEQTILVAVADSGLGSSRIPHTPRSPKEDAHGHGTHVSGTIAATNQRAIIDHYVLENSEESLIQQLDAIIHHSQAKVINLSVAGAVFANPSAKLKKLMAEADSKGIIIVKGSGNDESQNQEIDFKKENNVIVVGGVGTSYQKASFGNFGVNLSIAAPAIEILSEASETAGNEILSRPYMNKVEVGSHVRVFNSGTSMATPQVSGSVATLKLLLPNLKTNAAETILGLTATPLRLETSQSVGAGMLNHYQAYKFAAYLKEKEDPLDDLPESYRKFQTTLAPEKKESQKAIKDSAAQIAKSPDCRSIETLLRETLRWQLLWPRSLASYRLGAALWTKAGVFDLAIGNLLQVGAPDESIRKLVEAAIVKSTRRSYALQEMLLALGGKRDLDLRKWKGEITSSDHPKLNKKLSDLLSIQFATFPPRWIEAPEEIASVVARIEEEIKGGKLSPDTENKLYLVRTDKIAPIIPLLAKPEVRFGSVFAMVSRRPDVFRASLPAIESSLLNKLTHDSPENLVRDWADYPYFYDQLREGFSPHFYNALRAKAQETKNLKLRQALLMILATAQDAKTKSLILDNPSLLDDDKKDPYPRFDLLLRLGAPELKPLLYSSLRELLEKDRTIPNRDRFAAQMDSEIIKIAQQSLQKAKQGGGFSYGLPQVINAMALAGTKECKDFLAAIPNELALGNTKTYVNNGIGFTGSLLAAKLNLGILSVPDFGKAIVALHPYNHEFVLSEIMRLEPDEKKVPPLLIDAIRAAYRERGMSVKAYQANFLEFILRTRPEVINEDALLVLERIQSESKKDEGYRTFVEPLRVLAEAKKAGKLTINGKLREFIRGTLSSMAPEPAALARRVLE